MPEPLNVHGLPVKEPVPSLAKLTVPPGVLFEPVSLSVTVTVQLVDVPTATDPGVQLTLVLVDRGVTVTLKGDALLLLVAWTESLGV